MIQATNADILEVGNLLKDKLVKAEKEYYVMTEEYNQSIVDTNAKLADLQKQIDEEKARHNKVQQAFYASQEKVNFLNSMTNFYSKRY